VIIIRICLYSKIPFTGRKEGFESYYLDLDEYESIKQYVMDRKEEEHEYIKVFEKLAERDK
jgi:hypothetical protein